MQAMLLRGSKAIGWPPLYGGTLCPKAIGFLGCYSRGMVQYLGWGHRVDNVQKGIAPHGTWAIVLGFSRHIECTMCKNVLHPMALKP